MWGMGECEGKEGKTREWKVMGYRGQKKGEDP